MLRKFRIIIAAIVGVLFLYLFTHFAPLEESYFVAKTQIVSAIISGSIGVLVILALLTAFFGRVYCSVLCPLGILQDVIGWTDRKLKRLFKYKRKRRIKYEEPYNFLRYSTLAVSSVGYVLGSVFVLLLLDPHSNFGRIVTNVFKPIVIFFNNIAAYVLNKFDNYSLYQLSIDTSVSITIYSVAFLLMLIVLVVLYGRIWCNTLCPVGTILGIISRVSIFKLSIDSSKCTSCRRCATNCKSRCINEDEHRIDHSRCVMCYNCVDVCKEKAVSYTFRYKKSTVKTTPSLTVQDSSRKDFLVSLSAMALLPLGVNAKSTKELLNASRYPLPPGAGSFERFSRKCTACQLCVTRCPSHLLKPALFENSINGVFQPYMSFNVHKFCEYECKVCIDVCPNGALQKITLDEKKLTQVGVVNFVVDECIVKRKNQHCGACAEHCPTQAVRMVEYINGLTIPQIDPAICIGCGACESICPVRPDAIYIVRNDVQKQVLAPEIKKSEEIKIDDFGF